MRALGPGYWRDETSGVVADAVKAYLGGGELTEHQTRIMRLYLGQCINAPIWDQNPEGASPELAGLRDSIGSLTNRAQIARWINRALDIGIDPL